MRTRVGFRVAAALAAALVGTGAGESLAQGGAAPVSHGAPATGRVRLQRTMDPATYAAIAPVLDSAEARGLPLDPLVDKALYGAMRREPLPRIRTALSALAQRLRTAQDALAPAPSGLEIAAGADALAVGVPRETLRTIRAAARSRSVAVPLGVLTELVAQRVPLERASSMVVALLQKGATPTQLVTMGEDVRRDIGEGMAPDAALELRTRGVIAALPGGTPTVPGAAAVSPALQGPKTPKQP